jgi:hypothetical protein
LLLVLRLALRLHLVRLALLLVLLVPQGLL